MTIEKSNEQGASESSELPLKFILENKLTLKEIGAFVTVYNINKIQEKDRRMQK